MGSKVIQHVKLSEHLTITECADGFWLYDFTRGMNLSMRATSAQAAFVEALTYYQKRLSEVEGALADLKGQVNAFVSQFVDEDE